MITRNKSPDALRAGKARSQANPQAACPAGFFATVVLRLKSFVQVTPSRSSCARLPVIIPIVFT